MPDWSYHPVFRPLLFRLPAETARDVTLWGMGTLASRRWGPWVIETMGHMCPPEALQTSFAGLSFSSRIGVAPGLDVHHLALPALARLGFGFLEVGPVTLEPVAADQPVERLGRNETIWYPERLTNDGVNALVGRLNRIGKLPVPVGVRLLHRKGATAADATQERWAMAARLVPYVQFLTLDASEMAWTVAQWSEHVRVIRNRLREMAPEIPLFVAVPCDMAEEQLRELLASALAHGIEGVILDEGLRVEAGKLIGSVGRVRCLERVKFLREWLGPDVPLVAAGGVHEPQHALHLLEAGATFIQLHSGLVYAGPGLPKRINEAMAYDLTTKGTSTSPCTDTAPHVLEPCRVDTRVSMPARVYLFPSWIWALLLGLGMMISGSVAWVVAMTRVVLPYDEAFLGINREAIFAINPHLLNFMSHDRISLAGTMISIGVMYSMLAVHALRRGEHWARAVLLVSGGVGFASFFLYLGFGYFDKFHAVLSLTLLPCFLLGLRGEGRQTAPTPVNLHNDRRWRSSLWGQVLFIGIGGALTVAGITISCIGMTHVFVPEDLEYMHLSAHTLQAINAQLIPLIAHDRAGFGGALASDGLAVLLLSLWGFKQGARWLWWTLFGAGLPGFSAGIGIHFFVGYVDFWHLLPAFAGALLFVIALTLSYPFLHKSPLP